MSIDVQKNPDYLIFAEGAKQEELTEFPDINRGWGATIELTASKPPMEWFNGAFNRVDRHLLYLLQQGVPEWSDKITYPVNAVIKYNDILYIATNENNNAKPSTNTTKWGKLLDDASLTKKGIVQLNSAVNSVSESEAATPLAVKKTNDLATGANNAANTAMNIANTAKSDANIAKNTANTANNRANTAYNTAINAFPKTGGKIEGSVDATGGFYQKGIKLIKQGEYGVGHQNLSLIKISDNLNEQNASFFGSTYVNMPESIKPYINDGAGIVGIILPYRVTSEGWKFSSRIFSVVGDTPSKIFFQECHNGTWQKPVQLITNEIINNYQNGIGTGQTWQNVKESRAIGVNYTNTTDKPILVNISLTPADGGFNKNILYIDDIAVATSWQNSRNNNGGTLTAIVPVGSVYYLKSYLAIETWTELR